MVDRTRFVVSSFLLIVLWAGIGSPHGPMAPNAVDWVPGQVLVRLAPGHDPVAGEAMAGNLTPDIAALNARFGVTGARVVLPEDGPTVLRALASSGKAAGILPRERELMERLGRWVLLEADAGADVAAMTRAYAELDEVEVAEPNHLAHLVGAGAAVARPIAGSRAVSSKLQVLTSDPDFAAQWGLDFIDAPAAWLITEGSPGQVIAIIDTGVDLNHPDLASKIWTNDDPVGDTTGNPIAPDGCPGLCGIDDDGDGLIDEDRNGVQKGEPGWDGAYADDDDENGYIDDVEGWDWVSLGDGYEDNDPQDDSGHGTHCAGIAAAATNNGIGIAGACPLCTIMPLKAFQSSGTASYADIAKAIEYARRNGATVINMSFGSYANSSLVFDALSLAYSTSVLVAAAGNDHRSRLSPDCGLVAPFYPAHYDFVLGVEAGDSGGQIAGFSNCQYDLRAPGVGILSTVLDDSYATWSGTSMAAPFVAGTAGLLRGLQPGWDPDVLFGQLAQSGGNALQALTIVPQPDLRLVSFEVVDPIGSCPTCDGDGRPDAGETVEVVVTIRNWWGNATGVNGTLATADALATVITPASTWGSVGPNAADDNADNPFEVEISAAAGNNRDIVFDLVVDASNGGAGIAEPIVLTVQRGVERGGVLSVNETWAEDNLYIVTDNLLVMSGATLTIEPGTRVQIADGKSIMVRGELLARGTIGKRIVFGGNPDSWGGITFTPEAVPAVFDGSGNYLSGSILEYCILEGASATAAINTSGAYVARNIIETNGMETELYVGNAAVAEKNLLQGSRAYRGAIYTNGGRLVQNTIVGNELGTYAESIMSYSGNTVFENNGTDFRWAASGDTSIPDNYWGTTDPATIADHIFDFFDNPILGVVLFDPPLSAPDPGAPPVVADITLSPPSPVSVGTLTFTITFSHPMDTAIDPEVFFGPAEPWTSHPVDLNGVWLDPVTYEVQADITVFTGDGFQKISVVGAEDPERFPIPTGDHRFGFEIITAGTSAAQLSAVGDVGHINLGWFASSLPDVAGYNLYRAGASGGPYQKLNGALIVDTSYADYTVDPGVEYWYIYRVVNTEVEEGPDSDEASAAALDDVPPVITHTPVTAAPAGLPITIVATITDNVATATASLFHRELGSAGSWDEVAMINATGDQFTANIPAGDAVAPGREYYLEASDGVNTVQHGTVAAPHDITILDRPTVNGVSPDNGPLPGGTPVTLTGTNFQAGCSVSFGDEAATDVVVVDPQTVTCTTPAHYPAVVDVAVTNPNLTTGVRTRAYTYNGSATTIELPTTAHDRMSITTLGISTPGVEGVIAATFEFTYDAAVLAVQSTGAGSLTAGWTLSANTGTPGMVRLSLAGTAPATGLGALAEITVQVIGDPAAVSTLIWVEATLNEGAIPVNSLGGQVTVNNAFDVSGTVHYFTAARPVAGVTMILDGAASYSQGSGGDGAFAINNVPSANYALTASKSDGVVLGDISALDASLVLQYDAGLITLDPEQVVAGDVNASGDPTAYDASLILQYAVDLIALPYPGAGRIWTFTPPSRSYTPLNLDQTGQDFTAILIGDVTGNWGDGLKKGLGGTAALSFSGVPECGGGTVTISLEALDPGTELLASELTVTFDPSVVTVLDIRRGALTADWSMAVNDAVAGELRIALAGAQAVTAPGELFKIGFSAAGDRASWLAATRVYLNEGLVTADLLSVEVNACPVFRDGFEDGTSDAWN